MNRPTNTPTKERHEFPKLKAEHGEDPARFLQAGRHLATARIRGIDDLELLEAYRAVAKQILRGSTRDRILSALDDRHAELTGDDSSEDTPEPDPTELPADAEPVPATDGGVVESDDAPIHPDASGLDPGEVLVAETPDGTEHIWSATIDADQPYVMVVDGGEPVELSKNDAFSRLTYDPERKTNAEIDLEPPALAATGGDGE